MLNEQDLRWAPLSLVSCSSGHQAREQVATDNVELRESSIQSSSMTSSVFAQQHAHLKRCLDKMHRCMCSRCFDLLYSFTRNLLP